MMRLLQVLLVVACWVLAQSADAALISRQTTWTDGQVLTHSALNNEFDEAFDEINGNLNAANLSATLTFSDSDFLDLSAINMSSTTEGLKLGAATSCSSATAEGQVCWDTDDDILYMGNGSAAASLNFGDTALMDTSPQLVWRDTSDNVAYSWHLDTASAQQPWDYFTLWRGTKTSATGDFNIAIDKPLLQFTSADAVIVPVGTLQIGKQATGSLLLNSSTQNRTITLTPSAGITGSYTLTLPVDDGDANSFLESDGSGTLSWSAVDLANDITGTLAVANGG